MSAFNDLLSTIETIGTTNPIADDNGALTIAPRHKADPNIKIDEKVILEAKARKSEYDVFFKEVSIMEGASTITPQDNIIKTRVKNLFNDAVGAMGESYMNSWTNDKNIIEACNKLRPILDKIAKRL
jgi:hypothetical protein